MAPSINFDSVADLYDAYVRVDFDLSFFREEARRAGGKVLELTAGTGRLSVPLLRDGIDLTCVDYSEGMLAVLRRKLREQHLSCRVILADMAELSIDDRFDLIFIPFNALSETVNPVMHRRILERVRSHLSERGRFLCTMQNPELRTRSMDGKLQSLGTFPTGTGQRLIVQSSLTYSPSTQIAAGTQVYDILNGEGVVLERRQLPVTFYLIQREEFERLSCSAGFETIHLFGDYDRSPFDEARSPSMIWEMTKCASLTS